MYHDDFDDDEYNKDSLFVVLYIGISVIIILFVIILCIILLSPSNKKQSTNYIEDVTQAATVIDMTIDNNDRYEMVVQYDNGNTGNIIVSKYNFLKYKIGDEVNIKAKKYLKE